jgi:1-acyl-sn-glycerol-3-phosphate acyltransferase
MAYRVLAPGWGLIDRTQGVKQLIFAGYPHTSRRDFFLTQAISFLTGRALSTLVIETEFEGLRAPLLRMLHCLPVPQTRGLGLVDTVIRDLVVNRGVSLALCPEGQTERAAHWRTGYYIISLATGIPVSYVAFDYSRRIVTLGEPVQMTGNVALDLDHARKSLSDGVGYRSDAAGPVTFPPGWTLDAIRLDAQRKRAAEARLLPTGLEDTVVTRLTCAGSLADQAGPARRARDRSRADGL